jgi:hypothetical protein
MPWDQGPGLRCPGALVPGIPSKERLDLWELSEDWNNDFCPRVFDLIVQKNVARLRWKDKAHSKVRKRITNWLKILELDKYNTRSPITRYTNHKKK